MKRVLLLLFLIACSTSPMVVFDNGAKFVIEIADSPEERQTGLMHRDFLPQNAGMLFVFEDEAPRGFWMKNTLIQLDMIFLNADMTVVEIHENVSPCEEDPCPAYKSPPAQYVLEINGGLAKKSGIAVGSVMSRK